MLCISAEHATKLHDTPVPAPFKYRLSRSCLVLCRVMHACSVEPGG